jgi:hypothetical protein
MISKQLNLFNKSFIIRRKQLEDIRERRLDGLRRDYPPHTIEAVEWLNQNRDKLHAQVSYPLCAEINVKDAQYANAIENAIGQQNLRVNYLNINNQKDFLTN